ncbi:hypothetical protein LPB136_06980 [Tenacibaculum todarodis]|uniref:Lipoprotein n=1 Tax=Tenacibaculum todarodis TaxID=1850252 RepID=A0A1L3JJ22_9FLAO|nr:hypothetical protein [Tenacibaculum todarodis]APG65107.1 hypothetical protein LPB136_06980 [Tenacibaculum todarodis]
MTFKNISLILLFFSFLFFGCNFKKEEEKKHKSILIEKVLDTIKTKQNIIIEDCIFDQETQNDDFLKGIVELKNYSWDKKTKTATINISKNEVLEIYRGGCDHFALNAKFIVPKSITFKQNKDYILSRILWASKLIFNESDFKIIEESILQNKFSIDNSIPEDIHLNFLNNDVYNNYTFFYNSSNKKYNTFSIQYYLD